MLLGPCGTDLANELTRFWTFLKSDQGQMVFLVTATIRAIFYYLLRNPLPEARELACAISAVGVFVTLIAVSEAPRPQWAEQLIVHCTEALGHVTGLQASAIKENHHQVTEQSR